MLLTFQEIQLPFAFRHSVLCVRVTDLGGKLTHVNKATTRHLGMQSYITSILI